MTESVIKHVNLFVASPGGVDLERQGVHDVVARFNQRVGHNIGIHVDPYGWEQEPPEGGRPQSIINQELDCADIFVGVLGYRWGTPTGAFTSGFAEEFSRGFERFETTGSPNIWMYFKEVPEDRRLDPGDQLRQVLEFRASVQSDQSLLFGRFEDPLDFSEQLFDHLLEHFTGQIATPLSDGAEEPSADDGNSDQEVDDPVSDATDNGLALAFDSARLAVQDDDVPDDAAAVARIHLRASTWSAVYRGPRRLSEREVMYFSRHREQIPPDGREAAHLLRSVDVGDTPKRPSWSMLQGFDGQPLAEFMVDVLSGDRDQTVRWAAVTMAPKIGLAERISGSRVSSLLSDSYLAVKSATWALVATRTDDESLAAAVAWCSDEAPSRREVEITASRLAEEASFERFQVFAIEHANLIRRDCKRIGDAVTQFPASRLRTLLAASQSGEFTALVLSSGGSKLLRRDVEPLLDDADPLIRAVAARVCILREWKVSDKQIQAAITVRENESGVGSVRERETVRLLLAKRKTYEKLIESLDWFSLGSDAAFAALAEDHFDHFQDEIRSVTKSQRPDWADRVVSAIDPDGHLDRDQLIRQLRLDGDRSTRFEYIAAALSALAENGKPSDRTIAKSLLGSPDASVRRAALKVYSSFGTKFDVPTISAHIRSQPNDKSPAVDALRDICERVGHTAIRAALREDNDAAKAGALSALQGALAADLRGEIQELLYSRETELRIAAAHALGRCLSRHALAELFDTYPSGGDSLFYFDVIALLDRFAFSPEPFTSGFKT